MKGMLVCMPFTFLFAGYQNGMFSQIDTTPGSAIFGTCGKLESCHKKIDIFGWDIEAIPDKFVGKYTVINIYPLTNPDFFL